MSIDAIAALLGHKTLAMTMIYARIADKTVAGEYFPSPEISFTGAVLAPGWLVDMSRWCGRSLTSVRRCLRRRRAESRFEVQKVTGLLVQCSGVRPT
jgi:hypothetical protein